MISPQNNHHSSFQLPCRPEANWVRFIARVFVALVAQDVFLEEGEFHSTILKFPLSVICHLSYFLSVRFVSSSFYLLA